ncbi:hypothetical protein POM88_038869 [Heracleum sosnowskyi]|uniref:Uncharacterized protein n=1 Tax=Heracleum sosnowskyi TaxID=360622 RepID=A0AAD8HB98_9APIA|nr:hypothetical protein POM88_038869 [Heracleum sosnowskyi]
MFLIENSTPSSVFQNTTPLFTLGRFPGPPIQARLSSRSSDYFGESEHHLHFIEVGPGVTLLSVRENFQEDSFLVLEIPGKAIRYNLVDRSFKVIWNFALDFGLEDFNLWHCGRFRVSQYIGPLSCV